MSTAPRVWLFADYNQAELRVVAERGPVPKLRQWFKEKVDVHCKVTRLIAEVVQRGKIPMPLFDGAMLFHRKALEMFDSKKTAGEERELCKRVVHGSNYLLGIDKLALTLGIDFEIAAIISKIYHALFPEIKGNYHKWVFEQVKTKRTIWMPEPVKFRKVFWDKIDDDVLRAATATYPQCTVGAMLNRTLDLATHIFINDVNETLRPQWEAWYGKENWDEWCRLRDRDLHTPEYILWSGFDVRLNVHDAGGWSIPDDPDLVKWSAQVWKELAEVPIYVDPKDPMVIPVDFKKGSSWGSEDLKDYVL